MRSQPFALLRTLRVNETDASVFFAVLNHKRAGNSTNHYLRRVQNFAFAMRWLFEPVIPGPEWPKIKKKQTMAISAQVHSKNRLLDGKSTDSLDGHFDRRDDLL